MAEPEGKSQDKLANISREKLSNAVLKTPNKQQDCVGRALQITRWQNALAFLRCTNEEPALVRRQTAANKTQHWKCRHRSIVRKPYEGLGFHNTVKDLATSVKYLHKCLLTCLNLVQTFVFIHTVTFGQIPALEKLILDQLWIKWIDSTESCC